VTGGDSATPGAVLLRSADDERLLQGLRTALSLAMGDRPATLYIAAGALDALRGSSGGEAAANLAALPEAGVAIMVEAGRDEAVPPGGRRVSRAQLLAGLTAAEFQQVF
jgi:hypothetical protein